MELDTSKVLHQGYLLFQRQYAIEALSPYFQKDIDVLEKVQRKAPNLVQRREIFYEDELKYRHITSLKTIRIRGNQLL